MLQATLRRICDFYHSLCTAHKVNIIRSTRTVSAWRAGGGKEGSGRRVEAVGIRRGEGDALIKRQTRALCSHWHSLREQSSRSGGNVS